MSAFSKKQAIVVIHGIGEQHPIVTLRGFVESIANYLKYEKKQARENEAVFWDRPDPSSGNYDTGAIVSHNKNNGSPDGPTATSEGVLAPAT